MATLPWIFVRSVTNPVAIVTCAAVGFTSGLLLWSTNRAGTRMEIKLCRMQRQLANMAGQISAIRDDVPSRDERP